MNKFTRWYNEEHRHSGIRYVTPAERHRGEDHWLLKQRDELYRQAQKIHPEQWSGKTRNWQPEGSVTLNPDRENRRLKFTEGDNYLDTYRIVVGSTSQRIIRRS